MQGYLIEASEGLEKFYGWAHGNERIQVFFGSRLWPLSLKWFRTSLENKPAEAQTGALASEVCVILAVPSQGGQEMWQDG